MKQVWQAFFKLAGLATLQSVIKTMKKASGSGQAQIKEGIKCFFWLYVCEKFTVPMVELTVIYHIFLEIWATFVPDYSQTHWIQKSLK